MAEVTTDTVTVYNIVKLSDLDFEVLKACVAVAKVPEIQIQLQGEGLAVPKKRLTEIVSQLFVDLL